MENVSEKDFVKKFSRLTPRNQRYLISIQEALSFAQNSHTTQCEVTRGIEQNEGHKKLNIYLEISGAARDEQGNPQSAGMCMTIGDPDSDEITGEEYRKALERITVEAVLKAAGLTGVYAPSACRTIMPQEYLEKYGD